MKKAKEPIPQFHIPVTAKAGLTIHSYQDPVFDTDHDVHMPHRDMHYMFFVSYNGSYKLQVDFKQFHVKNKAVGIILPGQVHQLVSYKNVQGYSIAFDTTLMPEHCKSILDYYFRQQFQLAAAPAQLFNKLAALGELMLQLNKAPLTSYTTASLHALLHAMLALIAGHVEQYQLSDTSTNTRAHQLERLFKQLLQENYRHWKKPADYAKAMNITVSHLSDSIRDVTGAAVSYHIQEFVILEAKRLLYHTNLTAKEVCFEIGYEDAVYFSRLFKKVTGLSPLGFRQQFRD